MRKQPHGGRWQEFHDERLREEQARATVKCSTRGCDALVVSIERYHVTVGWELESDRFPAQWTLGTYDTGTHFHLFCEAGHEVKMWGHQLPKRLNKLVYPGGDA